MPIMTSIFNCVRQVGRIELGQWIWGSYGATVSSIVAFAVGASRPTMVLAGMAGFFVCLFGSIGVSALKSGRENRNAERPATQSAPETQPGEKPDEEDHTTSLQ